MIKILSIEELQEKISNGDKLIVDFYSDTCGPCKAMLPILEELSNETDYTIYKINVHEEDTSEYGIRSIPTIIYFDSGAEVCRYVGLISKEHLLQRIESCEI